MVGCSNMKRIHVRSLFFSIAIAAMLSLPAFSFAEETIQQLTLQQTIRNAIKANLRLQRSQEEVKAARANKNASITNFFPTLNANNKRKKVKYICIFCIIPSRIS